MQDKVAIVVGISGMDGRTATNFLLNNHGYYVVGTYRRNTQILEEDLYKSFNNHYKLSLKHCDIKDQQSVKELFTYTLNKFGKIDEVYLLAAQSHVGKSFEIPSETIITNGMSAFNFLETIRELSSSTSIYYAGTSELLGGDPSRCPFDENSPFECRSPYSIGKELGVRLIEYYKQTYGLFATYGILFNHSNCFRNKDFFIRRVTNSAAKIALGKQKELVLGNINFYRDEHWSDFGVEMMWKMLQQESPQNYIICRGECFHGEQFLDESFSFFNLNWRDYVKIDKSRFRPNEVVKLVGNPQKAIDKLGWRPNRMSFSNHIKLMCAYDFLLEKDGFAPVPDVFSLFP